MNKITITAYENGAVKIKRNGLNTFSNAVKPET